MSLRKGLVRFVVVAAPFVFCSLATQTRAQSQDETANATAPLYKTVSIKPTKSSIHADRIFGGKGESNEFTGTNLSTRELIQDAYHVNEDQIVGAPGWLDSKRYDIEAKAHNPAAWEGDKRMLQGLLSDYFKLAVHRETRLIPVYELVIAGDGPKLRESDSSHDDSAPRVIQVENGRIMGREVPIATLARILSDQLGRPVLDSTKLSSHYDVTLQWPTAPYTSGKMQREHAGNA